MPRPGENNNNPQQVNNNEENVDIAIQREEERLKEEQNKNLQQIKLYDETILQYSAILENTKKSRDEKVKFKDAQKNLLEMETKELDKYIFEKREKKDLSKKDTLKVKSADLFNAEGKLKIDDNNTVDKLNDIVSSQQKSDSNDNYKLDTDKVRVNSFYDLVNLSIQANVIKNEILQDSKKAANSVLTEQDRKWMDKYGQNNASKIDYNDLREYNSLNANREAYSKKRMEYTKEVGASPKDQDDNLKADFNFYKELVARRLLIKKYIKDTAMSSKSVKHFADLTEHKDSTDEKKRQIYEDKKKIVDENIKKYMQQNPDNVFTKLGYKADSPKSPLDDYFDIENKINSYGPRIIKLCDENIRTSSEKEVKDENQAKINWIKNHQSDKVDNLFDKKGNFKEKYSELGDLANKFDPSKDRNEVRKKLEIELDKARFNYYKSLQSELILQKNALDKAIEKSNKEITKNNNNLENERKEYEKWKDQEACDARYLEEVNKRKSAATSKRRKMLIGSALTGFATKIADAVGENVEKAGFTVASGIVKGEVTGLENEINKLEKAALNKSKAIVGNYDKEYNNKKIIENSWKGPVKGNKDELLQAHEKMNEAIIKEDKNISSYEQIQNKIVLKKDELEKAKAEQPKKLKDLEDEFFGKIKDSNKEKLEKNKAKRDENDMLNLATEINNATTTIPSLKISENNEISNEVIKDYLSAGVSLTSDKLTQEEAQILREDKDLLEQMKTLQEYSDKLGKYLTKDNMKKVDTVVGLAETLFSAYNKITEYLGDDEEDKKEEENKEENKEEKKEEDKEEKKEENKEEKKEENKEENKEEKKEENKEENKEEKKEEEEAFKLNIKDTISDLREKAKSIEESMEKSGEDKDTIIENISQITIEAGKIVKIVSNKLKTITNNMESSYEEAKAREEAENSFLNNVKETKESPVKLAQKGLDAQLKIHQEFIDQEIKNIDTSIQYQEKMISEVKQSRNAEIENKNLIELKQKELIDEINRKAKEETDKINRDKIEDTKAITDARKELENAENHLKESQNEFNKATETLTHRKAVVKTAEDALRRNELALNIIRNDFNEGINKFAEFNKDNSNLSEKEKKEIFKSGIQKESDELNKTIHKKQVKGFFIGLANSVTQNAKGFMDQLAVGVSEAVVKGKVKQMEDELKEQETLYKLKGDTALAKGRAQVQHTVTANEIYKNNTSNKAEEKDENKKLESLESKITQDAYTSELKAANEAKEQALKLQQEREVIQKDIVERQKKLADAKIDEKKKLDDLKDKLKEYYKDPKIAKNEELEANRTYLNIKKNVVENYGNKMLESGANILDVVNSSAYNNLNANIKQLVLDEAIKNKKDKEIIEKNEDIEKYSEKFKGIFTPKNMGRIDTVVSAAETLVSFYGTIKQKLAGGGKPAEEDEEQASFAETIANMKEKAVKIREGMLAEGDSAEKEQGVVENVIDIMKSMRNITDNISNVIDSMAEENLSEIDDLKSQKEKLDSDLKKYDEIFNENPNISLNDAFTKKQAEIQERIAGLTHNKDINEKALEEAKNEGKDEKNYDIKKEELKKAENKVEEAKKKLDDTIAAEKQRLKEEADRKAKEIADRAEQEKKEIERKNKEDKEREEQRRKRAEEEKRLDDLHKENDPKMEKLNDILLNLKDTGTGYLWHKNTDEFNKVTEMLEDFLKDKDKNIDFHPDKTKNLTKALTDYLDEKGMKTAHHSSGDVRKENVLAALAVVDLDKAKEYEQKALSVRKGTESRKKVTLSELEKNENVNRKLKQRRLEEKNKKSASKTKDSSKEKKAEEIKPLNSAKKS